MGTHFKFTRPDKKPLGTVESVQKAILAVLPEVRFCRESLFEEKIEPTDPVHIQLSKRTRNLWSKLPPVIIGEYRSSQDQLRVQFDLGRSSELSFLHVTVKGDSDAAQRLLDRIATALGWSWTIHDRMWSERRLLSPKYICRPPRGSELEPGSAKLEGGGSMSTTAISLLIDGIRQRVLLGFGKKTWEEMQPLRDWLNTMSRDELRSFLVGGGIAKWIDKLPGK